MKKAIRYSAVISFVFLVLFANLFFLMRISLLESQTKGLERAAAEIYEQIKDGDFSGVTLGEKDIDFVVYSPKSRKIFASSNNAIPPLPATRTVQRYSIKSPVDAEKRITVLYLTKSFPLVNGKIVCVQVSVPAEKEIFQKLLLIFPRSLLKILIPLIVILFFALSFYFLNLEKKYDTQKEFIANVSHELKTPLAVISGHADLLRRHGKKLLEKDEGEFEKSTQMIVKESENMTKIVQNLLEMTRLENRLIKPNRAEFSVQEFFEEIRHESDVLIEIEVKEKDIAVFTDKNLLRQIFSVAIENAKKHSKSENLKITLRAEKKGRKTVLSICDNGTGFSKEALSRAFDRFYSGDKSHKTGSGIGLSIAKAIARTLGTRISLENDGGAVVRVVV